MDTNKLLPGELPNTTEKDRYVCFLCEKRFDIFSVAFDIWCVCHGCRCKITRKACEKKQQTKKALARLPRVRPIIVAGLQPGMLFTLFREGCHMLRCKEKEFTEDGDWKVTGVFLGPNDEEQGEPVSEVYEADDEVYTP